MKKKICVHIFTVILTLAFLPQFISYAMEATTKQKTGKLFQITSK